MFLRAAPGAAPTPGLHTQRNGLRQNNQDVGRCESDTDRTPNNARTYRWSGSCARQSRSRSSSWRWNCLFARAWSCQVRNYALRRFFYDGVEDVVVVILVLCCQVGRILGLSLLLVAGPKHRATALAVVHTAFFLGFQVLGRGLRTNECPSRPPSLGWASAIGTFSARVIRKTVSVAETSSAQTCKQTDRSVIVATRHLCDQ